MNRFSIKMLFLKIPAMFTEKHLCRSLFLNKNAGLQSWHFIEKRLQQRCFPLNIAKSLRTPVLKNICERLFKWFLTWANNIKSNIESEEEIFSKTKQKNRSKNQLDEKNLPFHDALDQFVFLYFSTACLSRSLLYIIKDNRSKGLKNSLAIEGLTNLGPMEQLS